MLSPRNSFRATKAPDCTFVTSFAGMGEDDGDSKSGGVGGTIGEDNMGTDVNGNNSVVGGDDMPAGTVVVAEGGMAPRRSTERKE